jgi:hypothetical protein
VREAFGDLNLLCNLMSRLASISSLEWLSIWWCGWGWTDGAEDGIRKSEWGQMQTREDQEMVNAIRLADTNWSEHVMQDSHVPGSPYRVHASQAFMMGWCLHCEYVMHSSRLPDESLSMILINADSGIMIIASLSSFP